MAYEPLLTFRLGDVEDPDLFLGVVLMDKFKDIWADLQPMLEQDCCTTYRLEQDPYFYGYKVLVDIEWWNKEEELVFKLKHGPFPLER